MEELKRLIATTYKLVSMVHVCGNEVDIIATARKYLRDADKILKEADNGGQQDSGLTSD